MEQDLCAHFRWRTLGFFSLLATIMLYPPLALVVLHCRTRKGVDTPSHARALLRQIKTCPARHLFAVERDVCYGGSIAFTPVGSNMAHALWRCSTQTVGEMCYVDHRRDRYSLVTCAVGYWRQPTWRQLADLHANLPERPKPYTHVLCASYSCLLAIEHHHGRNADLGRTTPAALEADQPSQHCNFRLTIT